MADEEKSVKVHMAKSMTTDDCDADIEAALAQLEQLGIDFAKRGITSTEKERVLDLFRKKTQKKR